MAPKASEAARTAFWRYSIRAAYSAQARSKRRGYPCNISSYEIDELLVEQGWRCAISGIALKAPLSGSKASRDPFGPSLDRIIPHLGYVKGNVRIVCDIANCAMSGFGLENLMVLVRALQRSQRTAEERHEDVSKILHGGKPLILFN